MAEPERIFIQIEDAELDAAILALEEALKEKDLVEEAAEVLRGELLETGEQAEEALETAEEAKKTAEEAKDVAEDVIAEEGELKGMDLLSRRIISRIPLLRESRSLLYQIQALMKVSPEIAALIVAAQAITWLLQQRQREEERERRYAEVIRTARGFETQREARQWLQEQEQRRDDAYRRHG